MATKKMPIHPCQGCVYYKACGNTNRTAPCEGCTDMDYKAHYDKQREEIACLKMKLADSEERCRMLHEEVLRLSAIKATVEVIFGRKFDG